MSDNLIRHKVFIASPGGLDDERKAFAKEIEEYNEIEARHRSVYFQPVRWEDMLQGVGRPQSRINEKLEQCDYFIMVLHDRWGSDSGPNAMNATSGTEEEYLLALKCFEDSNYPMKQIVCLFKSVPPNQLADSGPQLQKVLDFKRKIEEEKKLLYGNFKSLDEFSRHVRNNLAQWLRDNDSPENQGGCISPETPPNDDAAYGIQIANTDKEPDEVLSNAWELAKEGKLVDAEIEFARAFINNPKEKQLLNYASFLTNTGQLDKALMMIDKAIHLANNNKNEADEADALNLKGNVLQTRGDLVGAEDMYKKSLAIEEKLGRLEGMASDYGNLGILLKTRGDLDGAEEMYKKSLEIAEKSGFKQIQEIVSKLLKDLTKELFYPFEG